VEALPRILATEADKVSTTLSDCFSKKGINIRTSVAVAAIDSRKEGVTVHLAGEESLDAEMALVAVGRKLNSDALGLEKAGVPRNDRGAIPVNSQMETEVSGIFAIGDVTGIWLLAHVATHQGLIAANNATGREAHIHYEAIPNVIYTTPEIATVGLTLKQAIAEGLPATIGAFPFQALGKAQASQHIQGFAQIVTNKKTGQILGAQVVGHEAGTLISEMTLAVQNELTIECLTETVHAHPTISEAWLEAAMVVQESPLHLPPRPKRQLKEEHFIA
jgi:dihydrolipoamide dehydrogenase